MKILHTADWHLGKRLEKFSRHDEQVAVLNEICQIADNEAVDAVIIAGDLFDTFNPNAESEDLFYDTCKRLSNNGLRPVIAIAGNHDSPERINAPDPLARANGIVFVGLPNAIVKPFSLSTGLAITHSSEGLIRLKLPNYSYPLNLLLTPFTNEFRLKKMFSVENPEADLRQILAESWSKSIENCNTTEGVNILVSHLFFMKKGGQVPAEPDDGERSIRQVGGSSVIFSENVPPQVQYVALGHLHRQQEIDKTPCPIVYSGSLLGYSFNEENQQKYVVIVEAKPKEKVRYKRLSINSGKRLLRENFEDVDKALDWLLANQDALVEITIICDTYLKGEDNQRLNQAHNGIVHIYAKPKKQHLEEVFQKADLSKDIESLFVDYFTYKKKQAPNGRILQLFKEIISIPI